MKHINKKSSVYMLFVIFLVAIGYSANSQIIKDGDGYGHELIEALHIKAEKARLTDRQAPAFSLSDHKGNKVSSESFNGSYLVIHIATTWCPFCNAEAPYLERLNQDYKDKNVKVLIIDVKEPRELVQASLQDRFNLSFPVLLDPDGSVAASFALMISSLTWLGMKS